MSDKLVFFTKLLSQVILSNSNLDWLKVSVSKRRPNLNYNPINIDSIYNHKDIMRPIMGQSGYALQIINNGTVGQSELLISRVWIWLFFNQNAGVFVFSEMKNWLKGLSAVIMPSIGRPFARGLDYVAASRPTELNKLFLLKRLEESNFNSFQANIIAIKNG